MKNLIKKIQILFGLGIIIPGIVCAADITCYSAGKQIYHGQGKKIQYTEQYIAFIEKKTNTVIFVFADCILKGKKK